MELDAYHRELSKQAVNILVNFSTNILMYTAGSGKEIDDNFARNYPPWLTKVTTLRQADCVK